MRLANIVGMSRYREIPAEVSTAIQSQDWPSLELLALEAFALMAIKPDTDFDGEKLFWKPEHLEKLASLARQKKNSRRGIVQSPVVRHLNTRACGGYE